MHMWLYSHSHTHSHFYLILCLHVVKMTMSMRMTITGNKIDFNSCACKPSLPSHICICAVFLTECFSISNILAANFDWLLSLTAFRLDRRWPHQSSLLCGSTSTRYSILSSFDVSLLFNFWWSVDVRMWHLSSSVISMSIFTNCFMWSRLALRALSQLLEAQEAITYTVANVRRNEMMTQGLLIYVHAYAVYITTVVYTPTCFVETYQP